MTTLTYIGREHVLERMHHNNMDKDAIFVI